MHGQMSDPACQQHHNDCHILSHAEEELSPLPRSFICDVAVCSPSSATLGNPHLKYSDHLYMTELLWQSKN